MVDLMCHTVCALVIPYDENTSVRGIEMIVYNDAVTVGEDGRGLEDDAVLLKVIEAYCTSTKTRQTVNSCE